MHVVVAAVVAAVEGEVAAAVDILVPSVLVPAVHVLVVLFLVFHVPVALAPQKCVPSRPGLSSVELQQQLNPMLHSSQLVASRALILAGS